MAYKPTEIADCSSIAKAFERGAAFSATQESVFAMMTPILSTTRVQSTGITNQLETREALSVPQTSQQKIQEQQGISPGIAKPSTINFNNLDKATDEDEALVENISGNFFPTGTTATSANIKLFNTECIPCDLRLEFLGELEFKVGINTYLDHWREWLTGHLNNLLKMLDIFKGIDGYIDLCALLDFLKDFICVPDLARMLSALMALQLQQSFEFNGVFDLILALAAPILQPFLSNVVDMLLQYILMVTKPLNCIIDSIQQIIAKLDYNVLFQNINENSEFITARQKNKKIPLYDINVNFRVPLDAATGGAISSQVAKEQKNVETAAVELKAIQKAASNVDASDPEAVERYKKQKTVAEEKYNTAVDERNLSELGEVNKSIESFQQSFNSSLFTLIDLLRKAIEMIEGFFQDLFSELQKLMGGYLSGSGSYLEILSEKFLIIQMIQWISAIIKIFSSDLHCDDEEQDIKVERLIPAQQGTKIWTDDQGKIHIEEDPALIENAVNETVKVLGVTPPGGPSAQELDKGTQPTEATPRQKLKSLIEFTGDPVLDTSIARVTEALTTPVSVIFKCPLQTTVSQAEQVNKWVKELNTLS